MLKTCRRRLLFQAFQGLEKPNRRSTSLNICAIQMVESSITALSGMRLLSWKHSETPKQNITKIALDFVIW